MLVYCLLGRVDYEGSTLLGVYASAEDVKAARLASGWYDSFYIEVRRLGGPAGESYEVGAGVIDL